jgi:outer membrane autotransporter protein
MGSGGTLHLNTYLFTDPSPSDKLVIDGGPTPAGTRPIAIDGPATATGTTLLHITNANGPGALTTGNGIQVVQAINGGTTSANAFTLDGVLRPGAFNYNLFRGGINGSDPNSWFLRSNRSTAGRAAAGPLSNHRAGVGNLRRGAANRSADGAHHAEYLA